MKRIEKIVSNRPQTPPGRGRIAAGVAGLLALALVAAALWATPEIAAGDDASISWMPESVKRWEPQLERAAAKHGVDASLLAVMVLLESRGNPAAESAWGALGLLQVMPRTGERIAEARGIDGFQVEQLRDPETNLDFGAWYLARQMQTFGRLAPGDEAVRLAAAAYNGGPGHLRAHLEEGAPLREETRRYADLVRNLWNDRDAAESATFEATFDGGGY